jgi:hypothetical protein
MTTEPRRVFWAQIALGLGGVIQILGMPIIVGALHDHWGYSDAYAGYITSKILLVCVLAPSRRRRGRIA